MPRQPLLVALRALGLGDLLVAVPALRALRRAFPEHRRLLATPEWLHPLTELVGGWDEPVAVVDLGPRWPRWLTELAASTDTVAVNLHGKGPESAALLDQLAPARRIGHRGPGWPGPEWVEELPERSRWCRLLAGHGIPADETDLRLPSPPASWARPARDSAGPGAGPGAGSEAGSVRPGAVLVHPGAAYGAKRWPVHRFAQVAAHLRARGHTVLVTGNAADRDRAAQLARLAGLPQSAEYAGRTDIRRLAALVSTAALVISGDTGIAHLAVGFGVPTVTLFGPADPRRWGPPPGGPHLVLHGPGRRGDPFAEDPDPALLAITVPEVQAAAASLLS
jgi:ADP-heptose:LPS heptosyltransferase